MAPNPATALARLIAALHDGHGRVAIPGFYDDVRLPSAREREDFARLPFDEQAWLEGAAGGAQVLAGEPGWSTLERIWIRPTAEVNGIYGGYTGPGAKTIVPRDAVAKLSFRLVADQRPERIAGLVADLVNAHTPAGITSEVRMGDGVPAYGADPDHPAVLAARDAVSTAFDIEALYCRAGGSGPAGLLHRVLDVPIIYLSGTLPDDRIHAPNERVVVPVLLRGTESMAILFRLLPQRLRDHETAT